MPPKVKVGQNPDGTPESFWIPVNTDTLTDPKIKNPLGAAKVDPGEGRIYRKLKEDEPTQQEKK